MLFAFICKDKPGHLQVRLDTRPDACRLSGKAQRRGHAEIRRPVPRRRRQAERQPGRGRGGRQGRGSGDPRRATPMPRQACSRASRSGNGTGPSTSRQALDRRRGRLTMNYWLFKSEPSAFSFEMLKAKGKAGTQWDGVRNYAARNNMRAMQIGDLGFFYHSNEGLDVVGIVEVCSAGPSRHHDRRRALGMRRHPRRQGRAEAADARRDQGQPEACRDGAGQARPAFRAAGDAGRMEGSLPHGRADPAP